uniref:DUF2683 family protein n=1 Tax=Flavobacterium sp. TaxID=239 RepID=UPI00404B3810
MTTITLQIDEKSKKGKALLAFLKAFKIDQNDDISLVEEPKSPYNKDFVKEIKDRIEKRDFVPFDDDFKEYLKQNV